MDTPRAGRLVKQVHAARTALEAYLVQGFLGSLGISAEVRGEFSTIETKVPGIRLGDLLPMSAKMMDKWSIVRSLHHHDAGHSTGDQICFTGYNSGPAPRSHSTNP